MIQVTEMTIATGDATRMIVGSSQSGVLTLRSVSPETKLLAALYDYLQTCREFDLNPEYISESYQALENAVEEFGEEKLQMLRTAYLMSR